MRIKYITESTLVAYSGLMMGDVFMYGEHAYMKLADPSSCRLLDGCMMEFAFDDKVLPMPQSIIEVKA